MIHEDRSASMTEGTQVEQRNALEPLPASGRSAEGARPPAAGEQPVPASGEHAEKGSFRSMWELLMQLRILLPYLNRLIPLLDKGVLKAAPDLTGLHKEIQQIQAGSRETAVQARNQALQLERIDEQLLRLRELGEQSQQCVREISSELGTLARRTRALVILCLVLLVLVAVVLALLVARLGL